MLRCHPTTSFQQTSLNITIASLKQDLHHYATNSCISNLHVIRNTPSRPLPSCMFIIHLNLLISPTIIIPIRMLRLRNTRYPQEDILIIKKECQLLANPPQRSTLLPVGRTTNLRLCLAIAGRMKDKFPIRQLFLIAVEQRRQLKMQKLYKKSMFPSSL